MPNEATHLARDYYSRLALSKIGVTSNFDELTDFEIDYLTEAHIVANQVAKEEMDRKSKKPRKGRRRGR